MTNVEIANQIRMLVTSRNALLKQEEVVERTSPEKETKWTKKDEHSDPRINRYQEMIINKLKKK